MRYDIFRTFLPLLMLDLISASQPLSAQLPPVEAPVPERPEFNPRHSDYPGQPVTGWPNVLVFQNRPHYMELDRYWASAYDRLGDRQANGWFKIRYGRELLPILEFQNIHENEILPLGGNLYWVRSISRQKGMQLERVGFTGPPGKLPCSIQIAKPNLFAVPTQAVITPQQTAFGYPELQEYYAKPSRGDYWKKLSFVFGNKNHPIPYVVVKEILSAENEKQQHRVTLNVYDRWADRRDYPTTFTVGDVVPIGKQGSGLKITRIQPAIDNLWVWCDEQGYQWHQFRANLRGWVEFEIVKLEAEK